MDKKEALLDEYFEIISQFPDTKNPLKLVPHVEKIQDFITGIYDRGFQDGYKEGKKHNWTAELPKN